MKRLPTTDLYFLNACGHRVRNWRRSGPLRRLGENCFSRDGAVLLLRRDRESLMEALCRKGGQRLLYLIDDDIEAARDTQTLPAAYRARLSDFHDRYHRRLSERADTLIVTSDMLARKFSWHPDVRTLGPIWHLPIADDRHYDLRPGAPLEIAHLGSGSHAAGHDFLGPVVEAVLASGENVRFTYFGAAPGFGRLDGDRRVRRIRPKTWAGYRRWIRGQRFHLALYPIVAAPFNSARSINKLIEHGIVGAAAVYSNDWEGARGMGNGAMTAQADPQAWIDCILGHLQPQRLRDVHRHARPGVERLNEPWPQRRFWSGLMDVEF